MGLRWAGQQDQGQLELFGLSPVPYETTRAICLPGRTPLAGLVAPVGGRIGADAPTPGQAPGSGGANGDGHGGTPAALPPARPDGEASRAAGVGNCPQPIPGRLGVWRKNFRPSSASSGRGSGRRSNWPIAGISVVQDRRGHQPQPPQGPHAASSLPKLQGSPAPVNAVAHRLQFLMGPGFHDLPTNDDDDSIHVPHRGEPVRDDKGSTPTHQ